MVDPLNLRIHNLNQKITEACSVAKWQINAQMFNKVVRLKLQVVKQ